MKTIDRAKLLARLGALRGWSIFCGEAVREGGRLRGHARTFERERTPLLAIRDAYPKLILTWSGHAVYASEGIQIVDPARWLAREEDVGL